MVSITRTAIETTTIHQQQYTAGALLYPVREYAAIRRAHHESPPPDSELFATNQVSPPTGTCDKYQLIKIAEWMADGRDVHKTEERMLILEAVRQRKAETSKDKSYIGICLPHR